MFSKLHNMQQTVKHNVAINANDPLRPDVQIVAHAANEVGLMKARAVRRHHIPEWAAQANITRADLARATGADKATVTRWFQGNMPQDQYLLQIAEALKCNVEDLMHHPDEVWVMRFLQRRSDAERRRIKATLEAAFPDPSCE
jgi:DNA-binding Xre family transcriptional regulator